MTDRRSLQRPLTWLSVTRPVDIAEPGASVGSVEIVLRRPPPDALPDVGCEDASRISVLGLRRPEELRAAVLEGEACYRTVTPVTLDNDHRDR